VSEHEEKLSIDHIGIAVTDLDQARELFSRLLDIEPSPIEEVPSDHVRVSFFRVGDSRIELLEPTGDEGAIHRFLQRRPQGVHHIALRVEGSPIGDAIARLGTAGFPVLGGEVRDGADRSKVAFVHPKNTAGVLFEFTQTDDEKRED
jgi:methylmalonyl-CoA/ethylmalonyl-CoA epimerase